MLIPAGLNVTTYPASSGANTLCTAGRCPERGVSTADLRRQNSLSPLPWQQLVISLNLLLNFPVAAGGRTALELQGFSHYVAASGAREAHLFANEDLPGWVSRVPVNTELVLSQRAKALQGP